MGEIVSTRRSCRSVNDLVSVTAVLTISPTANPAVLPTVTVFWTTSTTSAQNTVTVGSTAGLAVGEIVSTALEQTAGPITSIADGTHHTIGANVTTGSTTAAGTQFSFLNNNGTEVFDGRPPLLPQARSR